MIDQAPSGGRLRSVSFFFFMFSREFRYYAGNRPKGEGVISFIILPESFSRNPVVARSTEDPKKSIGTNLYEHRDKNEICPVQKHLFIACILE